MSLTEAQPAVTEAGESGATSPGEQPGAPSVLVTDAGRGSAVAILRSLARRGYRTIAASSNPRSAGFHSRFAAERVLYPDPKKDPAGCVETLRQVAVERGVALIIPVTDAVIAPLSEARDRFDGISRLALPEADALAVTRDKHRTLELARRLEVPLPETRLVRTAAEARELAPELGWPVVVKPQTSLVYQGAAGSEALEVCYAGSPERLEEQVRRFEGRCPVLLQEYCGGTGTGVELLLHEGRPLAAFQHRRLREVPITGGASAFRMSVPIDPVLYDYSLRLLQELRWTGLAMVEFRTGQAGPKLMEINGRVWGSLPLAVVSGMDFPARLADLCLNGPPPADEPVQTGYCADVRCRDLRLEVSWIVQVLLGRQSEPGVRLPRRRDALGAIVSLADPRCRFDMLDWDDPLPGLIELRNLLLTSAGRLRKKDG
jgi:predicted ATP-grasp superfamily ATP-dependent carboligase